MSDWMLQKILKMFLEYLVISDDDDEDVQTDSDIQLLTIVPKSKSVFARPLLEEVEIVEECGSGDAAKSVQIYTGYIKVWIAFYDQDDEQFLSLSSQ